MLRAGLVQMRVDYHPFKSMLNRYFAGYVGGASRPVFFDVEATCPGLAALTRSYPAIREECDRVLALRAGLPRYHEIDPGEAAISAAGDPDRRWTVFLLYILGHRPARNRALCPRTCRVLDGVTGLTQAFFSILDPGKSIPLHEGPYLGYLRYHLALRVPAENPPRLVVSGREHVWREGQALLFDDTWPHEVVNHGTEVRAVLIVDVLRPLPFWPSLANRLVARGLVGPTYGRAVARRAERRSAAPAAAGAPAGRRRAA